ncbi:MAG: glycosyltransferase family 4 protein [bacterium]
MAIAVFIRQLSLGGAEKQSLLLARELQMKYRTFLVVWSRQTIAPEYHDFIEKNGVSVVYLKGNAPLKFFRMWRFLKENRVTHLFNFLLINNFVGGLTGRMAGVKHIYGGIRNCEIVSSKLRAQRLIHNFISHKTIFNNYSGTKKLASQGFNKDKMVVVHNGIDVDKYSYTPFETKIKKKDKVVLFAGRVTLQKGPDYFIDAAHKVCQKMKNVKFVLAGNGDMLNRCIRMVAERGLSKNFIFPGRYSKEEGVKLMNMADVFVMPSVSEPFGLVPLEAMLQKTPAIISKQSGVNEVLANALKIDFWDTHQMANKIISVLKYGALQDQLSEYGSVEAGAMTWDPAAEKCHNIFDKLARL